MTLKEFYPLYLAAHSDWRNRRAHQTGFILACINLLNSIFVVNGGIFIKILSLIPSILLAYGFAWFGHFVFQHNLPMTFTNPWYSFLCYFKMIFGNKE